jgi:hypothetical protein
MKKYFSLWLFLAVCLGFTNISNAQLAQLITACDPNGNFQACNTQGISARAFAVISLPNVHVDTATGFNIGTNKYTVPATGLYFVSATVRSADNTPAVNFGAGIALNNANGDSVNFVWQAVDGIRHTVYSAQMMNLTAGDTLNIVGYCDNSSTCQVSSAQLVVQQQCQIGLCGGSGSFGGFTSTPTIGTLLTTSVANGSSAPAQTIALANAAQNSVWAGPSTGGAGPPSYQTAPTFNSQNLSVFVASGGSHKAGIVPDPGASAGTVKFLREDATFAVPPGINPTVNGMNSWTGAAWVATTATNVVSLFNSGTCSGYLKSNGQCDVPPTGTNPSSNGLNVWNTSAWTVASYTNIVNLFGAGSCSGYLKSDGTCATPSGGGNTVSTSLTNNHLSKANGANSIVDSGATDDGTTFTYPGPIVGTSFSTSCTTCGPGNSTYTYHTGTIGALAANSGGIAGPSSSGGTSYLWFMPASTATGIPHIGSATTIAGVNGAQLTVSAINLAGGSSEVTGFLPVANIVSATNADGTHFLRGDGIWAVPSGGGSTPTGTGFIHVTSGTQDGTASTDGSTLTGIVSASKWTTARTLAGNSVDGSANVAFVNKFIVQGTADAGLSAAQFLGALGTGLVKNTTTTGVLSIATAGTDYVTPTGSSAGLSQATVGAFGVVKPDGTSITIASGVISATTSGGTVTHTAGSLTASKCVIGNGTADITVDANCSLDGSGNLTVNSVTSGATTPGADIFSAGTGNINGGTLPANSSGWSAPTSGGTSYVIKMPATITAGIPTLATPGTTDGVNTSIMSVTSLAGAGAGITTGPTSSTTNDIVTMNGTNGQVKDSGTLISSLATLASPTFTGTPSLPTGTTGVTQTVGDNSTKLATTAFVLANAGSLTGSVNQMMSCTGTNICNGDSTFTNDRVGNVLLYPSLTTALSGLTLGSVTNPNGSTITIKYQTDAGSGGYGGTVFQIQHQFGTPFAIRSDGSVSQNGWIAFNGLGNLVDKQAPLIQYGIHLKTQTASIGATNIAATPVAGDYRICVHVQTTTAGSAGTVLGTVTWNNGASQTLATSTASLTTLGAEQSTCRDYTNILSTTAFAYSTTVAGATGSPQYSLDIQAWDLNQ